MTRPRARSAAAIALVAGTVLLGGCAEEAVATAPPVRAAGSSTRPAATSAPAPPPVTPLATRHRSAPPTPAAPMPESRPVRLDVPAIGVRTGELIQLGLRPDGTLEVPGDALTTGWFEHSPTPGELGPAVLAAHVDYDHVPGTFHRLHELPVGATAVVRRADGTSAEFTVTRVERYPKAAFPTERVYGDTSAPELRLITCGGDFDSATGNYLDNVVAYAVLTGGK